MSEETGRITLHTPDRPRRAGCPIGLGAIAGFNLLCAARIYSLCLTNFGIDLDCRCVGGSPCQAGACVAEGNGLKLRVASGGRGTSMSMNGGGTDAISAQQQSNNTTSSIGTHAPNAKANRAVSQPVDSHSVSRRLQSELMSLMTCGDPGISAFPDGDNFFTWVGTIKGSRSTVYEGLSYKLGLKFPTDYPFKPPTVKFDTPCFHPNVDQYGNICLDILQDKWSSAYDVRTILLSIQSLLGEPNNDSPLNSDAAALWNNQEEYRRVNCKQFRDAGGVVAATR